MTTNPTPTNDEHLSLARRIESDLRSRGLLRPLPTRSETTSCIQVALLDELGGRPGERSPGPLATEAPSGEVCASERCENPATNRLESGGVGSVYCDECAGRIVRLLHPTASWKYRVRPRAFVVTVAGVDVYVGTDELAAIVVAAEYRADYQGLYLVGDRGALKEDPE